MHVYALPADNPECRSAARHVSLPPAGRADLGPIFHACTSTTYKRTLGMFYSACCAYLNARPPAAVGWVVPKAYHIDALASEAAFRSRCVALSVKLESMGAALRFAGQKAAAKKARMQAIYSTMGVHTSEVGSVTGQMYAPLLHQQS